MDMSPFLFEFESYFDPVSLPVSVRLPVGGGGGLLREQNCDWADTESPGKLECRYEVGDGPGYEGCSADSHLT